VESEEIKRNKEGLLDELNRNIKDRDLGEGEERERGTKKKRE
jgi:hypothetical protein